MHRVRVLRDKQCPALRAGCPMRMATSGIKSSAARTLRQPAARHVQVRAIQEPETQTAEPAFEVPPPAPGDVPICHMSAMWGCMTSTISAAAAFLVLQHCSCLQVCAVNGLQVPATHACLR